MRARSPPVYLRDFAYANSTTEVMREDRPRADINAATSARSFAEYVSVFSLLRGKGRGGKKDEKGEWRISSARPLAPISGGSPA